MPNNEQFEQPPKEYVWRVTNPAGKFLVRGMFAEFDDNGVYFYDDGRNIVAFYPHSNTYSCVLVPDKELR